MANLDGVTIAFDLDNTLLDPTGARYESITSAFLAHRDIGLDPSTMREAYERVRRWGPILARLGFSNPLHDRGCPDGLAALTLHFAKSGAASTRRAPSENEFVQFLDDAIAIARATRIGSPEDRLLAERNLRKLLSGKQANLCRNELKAASADVALRDWAKVYEILEHEHTCDDVYGMIRDLASRGAVCVVISQGESTFQRAKLEQLGIARLVSGRALITQDARRIPGYEALDARIDAILDRGEPGHSEFSDQLESLWTYHCLLDLWGSKSPWFYARCLHALHAGGGNVEKRLNNLTVVSRNEWKQKPARFVMIGDRYEKDILPVIDLLGCDAPLTIHLRAGKYNDEFDPNEIPEWNRPTRSFTDLTSVHAFLTEDLTRDMLEPIESAPPIAPDGWFDRSLLRFGASSDLECVKRIADAISAIPSA